MALLSVLVPCPSKAKTEQKQRPKSKNYSVNIKGHKVKINKPLTVCVCDLYYACAYFLCLWRPEERVSFFAAGVTGSGVHPNVGIGSQTLDPL